MTAGGDVREGTVVLQINYWLRLNNGAVIG